MLVIDRKDGESIVIQNGEDVIEIILYKDKNQKYKIGVDAPEHYKIARKELVDNG